MFVHITIGSVHITSLCACMHVQMFRFENGHAKRPNLGILLEESVKWSYECCDPIGRKDPED